MPPGERDHAGPYQAVYNASKSFVQSFGEAIADELRDTGVTVTVLMPGPTGTEFFERGRLEDTKLGQGRVRRTIPPRSPSRGSTPRLELQVRPAPGDKGTELAARFAPGAAPSTDGAPQELQRLRAALRRTKQLAEVGWVHEADANRTARPTPLNRPLREATGHAAGEGRL